MRDKVIPLIQLGEVEVQGEFRPLKTISLRKFDIKVTLFSGGFDLFYKNHFDDLPLSEEDEAQSHRTQEQAQEIINDVFKYFSSKVEARTKEPVPQVVRTLSLEIITPQEEADKGLAYYFLQRKYPTHFEKWILVSSGQKLRDPGRLIGYGWQVSQGKPADDGAQR